ncbi:potassium transporter TrkG [uncultured Tateyamaria sp.]|uniref:TrkH family potassium uptake protein n=1 Tax=uncultured Tateyamaria sp. TaxID=455651 RepID=UPI002635E2ED|nr:potassium transporter TrkG [uncultured Tateyamaria sp.]
MTRGDAADLARRGQAAASVRARPAFVGRAVLNQTPVLAVLVGAPGVAALIEGERPLAAALLAPTVILAALGVWSRQFKTDADLRRIEAVATLALIFVLSTVLAVPGFMVLGLAPHDALFEAASGITTTGLSVARDAESWPVSAHFLRAWMQWCGGVAIAVAGVALLMDSGRAAQVLGKQSVAGTDYHASTRAKARLVLMGYSAITATGVVLSIPLFPGWWEGPMVALAAVSTGGFTPRDSSLADYSRPAQILTLALCVATSLSLLFYAVAVKLGPRAALRRGTVRTTLAILLVGSVAYVLGHGVLHGWEREALISGLLNQLSAQTTAGFSTAPLMPFSPLMLLLIVLMALGGDVGSTTGGIKTARASMLWRMVALVFLRLRLPERALSHLKIGDKRADAEAILFAAALLALYLASALIFWAALYAAGHPALPALFDAVSALSGVGLSAGVIGPDLGPGLKLLATFAMLLGRLEFFVLIALFLPSTWFSMR